MNDEDRSRRDQSANQFGINGRKRVTRGISPRPSARPDDADDAPRAARRPPRSPGGITPSSTDDTSR